MQKKYFLLLIFFTLVTIAAGVMAGRWYNDNRRSNFTEKYILFVSPEASVTSVMDSLEAGAGVLRPRSLRRCFEEENVAADIKPGRYVIEPSFTSIYVARMLVKGWQTPGNLTLAGTIRTKGRLAQKIAAQMMVDSASVAQALDSAEFLAPYGFTPENIFAMILPDTYQMYWTASVKDIFDRLKKEYDAFWTPERLEKAKAQKLSPMQVSILASIVSGETLKGFEYPRIAGVYLNRYRKGMRLQADPTIAFCFNYEPDRILKKHLQVDSPYNTYKYAGLPPAPIYVPPKACLEAVLSPENHKYIYFCASPDFDGTHRFAVGYNDHLKNAREFQRALTKRNKERASQQ
ncbi:MAG: endolytic transglycosylase MltG [Bacteroidales bacterium]|nr:endolytic transglycosylase MltG [Bacteroidales bacterium]